MLISDHFYGLELEETPKESDVLLQGTSTWHLGLCKTQLKIKQGVFHYVCKEDMTHQWLPAVPAGLKETLLQQCHDSKFGEHLGREKILTTLKQWFLHHGMATYVKLYVSTCRPYHMDKNPNKRPKAPLQAFQAG